MNKSRRIVWRIVRIFVSLPRRDNQLLHTDKILLHMKKTIITLMLALFTVGAWAQETQRLVVWQKSGEKVYYELADLPETTFEDGLLIISTLHTSVQYQLENIVRYTYEGVRTGFDLMPNEHAVSISREGDGVVYRGLKDGTTVGVYGSNGMLIQCLTAHEGQPLVVSVGQRPAGVYIVKCGSETIKLLRK